MDVVRQWLSNKINRKEISIYLHDVLAVSKIAIYGAGELGELLFDDLKDFSEIKVQYFIDKNADSLYYGIDDMEIFSLDELKYASPVDAIIITPYPFYDQIKEELDRHLKYSTQLVSLEDLVYKVE